MLEYKVIIGRVSFSFILILSHVDFEVYFFLSASCWSDPCNVLFLVYSCNRRARSLIMKFAGLVVLALGASAYVVTDAPNDSAIEARNPVRHYTIVLMPWARANA